MNIDKQFLSTLIIATVETLKYIKSGLL